MSQSLTSTGEWTLLHLARLDWVITDTYGANGRLHALRSFDDPAQAEAQWGGPGMTACGKHSVWLGIPGIFSRMGQERCAHCCGLTGLPRGKGSPKNDDACRSVIGLGPKRGES